MRSAKTTDSRGGREAEHRVLVSKAQEATLVTPASPRKET